jgi:hypothetical protein
VEGVTRYVSWCLGFAGFCLLAGAGIGAIDWWNCTKHAGGRACAENRTVAMVALAGAANTALGIAVQSRDNNP